MRMPKCHQVAERPDLTAMGVAGQDEIHSGALHFIGGERGMGKQENGTVRGSADEGVADGGSGGALPAAGGCEIVDAREHQTLDRLDPSGLE